MGGCYDLVGKAERFFKIKIKKTKQQKTENAHNWIYQDNR